MGEERLASTTDMLSKSHSRENKGGEQTAGLLTLRIIKQNLESDFRMEGI